MKTNYKLILKLSALLALANFYDLSAQEKLSSYVNPMIGTAGHGHTFPGAVMPFGMVQLSPDTRIDGSWDGCSGYHRSDSIVYGFTHTHLSGTGCSDWGDVLIMPFCGIPSAEPKQYASPFSHSTEKAGAGYYEVTLRHHQINARLTVTPRVGIHQYAFPKNQNSGFVIDLLHRDKTITSRLKMIDSVTIIGMRVSEAWAKEQHVYFAMKFSKPIKNIDYLSQRKVMTKEWATTNRADGAFIYFVGTEKIMVKVAISGVSEEGALANLKAEAPHWQFEQYKSAAAEAWDKQLKKIEISEADQNNKTKFYTALYHCCIHPSLNMDVDNQFRGRNNQIHTAYGFTNYSVFSLWDTYRALHPLFTIIEKERTKDFINSFLMQYKDAGRLPIWELSGNETDCMIGYHSVSVITDAWMKGLAIKDSMLLYKAMKASASYTGYGLPIFNQKDFLQVDDENESVSKSLEYAYDDWCIAQIAKRLKMKDDELVFRKRAQSYKNLFDASSGFMRPRKNGTWLSPFYGNEINNHFTEGNSWQYSFYVPHDLKGLIKLHGNEIAFEKKLDDLFTTSSQTRGREQADVTGLIGQYAHGNEPSHHMAFLYNYVGAPQKSIKLVKDIARNFYKNDSDGLIGNEDCGQMSAWYVFAEMGFYPVCPGSNEYVLTEPLCEKVKINLENGKTFVLSQAAVSDELINHIELNGKSSLNSFIKHENIVNGGELKVIKNFTGDMVTNYGVAFENRPHSEMEAMAYIPSPIINSQAQVFKDKIQVRIETINSDKNVCVYTLDGSEPTPASAVYTKELVLDSSCTVKAKVFSNSAQSAVTIAKFYKLKNNYQIQLTNPTNSQYSANGVESLVDGIYGDLNWRRGDWMGIQERNFECIVDLKQEKSLSYVALNCLQDSRSWILYPKKVSVYVAVDDGTGAYQLVGEFTSNTGADAWDVQIKKFEIKLANPTKARYVKVIAENAGKLPEYHNGAGGDSFIFCDELEIR